MILVPKVIPDLPTKSAQKLMVLEGYTNSEEFRGQPRGTLRFNVDVRRIDRQRDSVEAEVVMICEKDGFNWQGLYGETDFNGLPFAERFSDLDFSGGK